MNERVLRFNSFVQQKKGAAVDAVRTEDERGCERINRKIPEAAAKRNARASVYSFDWCMGFITFGSGLSKGRMCVNCSGRMARP